MSAFWTFIYALQHMGTCVAYTANAKWPVPIVYGGNCVQAWLDSLASNGAVNWTQVLTF